MRSVASHTHAHSHTHTVSMLTGARAWVARLFASCRSRGDMTPLPGRLELAKPPLSLSATGQPVQFTLTVSDLIGDDDMADDEDGDDDPDDEDVLHQMDLDTATTVLRVDDSTMEPHPPPPSQHTAIVMHAAV